MQENELRSSDILGLSVQSFIKMHDASGVQISTKPFQARVYMGLCGVDVQHRGLRVLDKNYQNQDLACQDFLARTSRLAMFAASGLEMYGKGEKLAKFFMRDYFCVPKHGSYWLYTG